MVEVSVIVPAYNAGDSLHAALASARSQWLRDIEIIVVDDASEDHTREVALATARADVRVRVMRLPANVGPSAARNAGIDAAKGTWIALLDADDLYLPQRLTVLTDAARSADCDLLADNIMLRSAESGRCLGLSIPPALADPRRPLTALEFARNDRPFPGGFHQLGYVKPLIRRAFLERHNLRYDTDIWCAEDFVFYMRCLLAGARIMLLPDAYYQYTLSGDSISQANANLARNCKYLEIGNARILTLARNRKDRATTTQLQRRKRNIAFLRTYYSYRQAMQRRRWSEAFAHLLKMPVAPVELTRLLKLCLARRIWRRHGIRHLTEHLNQIGKEPAC